MNVYVQIAHCAAAASTTATTAAITTKTAIASRFFVTWPTATAVITTKTAIASRLYCNMANSYSVASELAPIICRDLSVVRSSLAPTCALDKGLEVGGQHHLNTSTSSLSVSVDHATYQPNLNLRTNQSSCTKYRGRSQCATALSIVLKSVGTRSKHYSVTDKDWSDRDGWLVRGSDGLKPRDHHSAAEWVERSIYQTEIVSLAWTGPGLGLDSTVTVPGSKVDSRIGRACKSGFLHS
ncbi:hypothetical protein PoB_006884500 [Plakobranchus ocellatus]|uniref:Uncharacterized protein n=1 Tax=Plakobranchus ocellatus TaxID=259542 RepID=A0AAV4DE16_9GAST|nr:hypothetical protein PoB_006884500 [Plakobranchus ocellatus]